MKSKIVKVLKNTYHSIVDYYIENIFTFLKFYRIQYKKSRSPIFDKEQIEWLCKYCLTEKHKILNNKK